MGRCGARGAPLGRMQCWWRGPQLYGCCRLRWRRAHLVVGCGPAAPHGHGNHGVCGQQVVGVGVEVEGVEGCCAGPSRACQGGLAVEGGPVGTNKGVQPATKGPSATHDRASRVGQEVERLCRLCSSDAHTPEAPSPHQARPPSPNAINGASTPSSGRMVRVR